MSGGLTTSDIDRIFEHVAPKRKVKVVGMGSIREVSAASSYAPRRRSPEDDPVVLRAMITSLQERVETEATRSTAYQTKIASLQQRIELDATQNDEIFDILATGNPAMQAMLREKRRLRAETEATAAVETSATACTSGSSRRPEDDVNLDNYDIVI